MTAFWAVDPIPLLAAQGQGAPWWFYPLVALIGLVMIGIGAYGIHAKKAVLGRQRALLRLFGIEEVTGKWAVIVGGAQCAAGVLALLVAITGPFWAGKAAENGRPGRPPSGPAPSARPAAARLPVEGAPSEDPAGQTAPLLAGRDRGDPFQDSAPEGGLLVGLRCAKGESWGGALHAVQPVYQVGAGYALGRRHGMPGGDEHDIIARPGYAVGAVNARAGLVLNAVQLVFYRIDGTRLDLADRYQSDWVGCEGGGPFQLDPKGDPITGIFGTCKRDIVSLGIEPTLNLCAPVPLPSEAPPQLDGEAPAAAAEFRRWVSADGKFTVEARLVVIQPDSVQLERRDGKVITVPLAMLSEADVRHVRTAGKGRDTP